MAIKASDFSTAAVQVVAFTQDRVALTPSRVLGAIVGALPERFNGDVQMLPIPKEMPDELPRLEVKSEDGQWSFTSSFSRVSAAWTAQERGAMAPDNVIAECLRAVTAFTDSCNPNPINRLACVINRIASVPISPHDLIACFCKPDVCDPARPSAPLRHSKAFQLHNLKKYESRMKGVWLNSWVRCKAQAEGEHLDTMVVEQDLNTPHNDPDRQFTLQEIGQFFEMIRSEADTILHLYFPG
jgi:hypothetical protein